VPFGESANRRYFEAVMQRFGLTANAALLEFDGLGYAGLSRREIAEACGLTAAAVQKIIGKDKRATLDSPVTT
jgi:hypothetical protein